MLSMSSHRSLTTKQLEPVRYCPRSDMRVYSESVEFALTDKIEQLDADLAPPVLFKSTWGTIALQTNLDQRLLIDITDWSVESDDSGYSAVTNRDRSPSCTGAVHYFKRQQAQSTLAEQQRTSTFRYVDSNLLPASHSSPSTSAFTTIDQWLDLLREPFVNISVRQFNLQYTSPYVFTSDDWQRRMFCIPGTTTGIAMAWKPLTFRFTTRRSRRRKHDTRTSLTFDCTHRRLCSSMASVKSPYV